MQPALQKAILSPSYTPRVRDCEAVVDLVVRGLATPQAVTVALLRVGKPAIPAVERALASAPSGARQELVPLLGRLIIETAVENPSPLLGLLLDPDRKVARAAVIALGKLPQPSLLVESRLIELWSRWTESADRRAIAEALGKIGGPSSLTLLSSVGQPSDQSVLSTVIGKATQRLSRTVQRAEAPAVESRVRATVPLPAEWPVTLRLRAGVEPILLIELQRAGITPLSIERSKTLGEPSRMTIPWSRPLGELFALRTFVDLAFPLSLQPFDLADVRMITEVASALSNPAVETLLRALTDGSLRYRWELIGVGPRRSFLHKLAQEVSERLPYLVNDPTDSPWQFELLLRDERAVGLSLVPKQLVDPRFAYRHKMVAAASQPTLAAALARLLSPRAGDVVWDPFVGSGGELCEVSNLAPGVRLIGSDREPAALATARANTDAAAARVELLCGDALSLWPSGVTCVISNPPMGRRVCRGELEPLMIRFVTHVARKLPPGGRLCWLNPMPNQTSLLAEGLGLARSAAYPVDMNGFWAQMELWRKR